MQTFVRTEMLGKRVEWDESRDDTFLLFFGSCKTWKHTGRISSVYLQSGIPHYTIIMDSDKSVFEYYPCALGPNCGYCGDLKVLD